MVDSFILLIRTGVPRSRHVKYVRTGVVSDSLISAIGDVCVRWLDREGGGGEGREGGREGGGFGQRRKRARG